MSEPSDAVGGAVFRPWARRAAWLLVGVSVIGTLVSILVGSRYAESTPTPRDSFTMGPLGHRAFSEVLTELGVHVIRDRRGAYGELRSPLMIIEPDGTEVTVNGQRRTLREILDLRAAAGRVTVVVLPKWTWATDVAFGEASPDPEAGAVLEAALPGARLDHAGEVDDEMTRRTSTGALGRYDVALPWPQVIVSYIDEPLLVVDEGALVVRRDDGTIVVSDPDLLHSWNIHRADHAQLFRDLFTHHLASDTVVVDEVFHGHGQRLSLATALGEWPTWLVTAHALFVLLLVVLLGSKRFGRPVTRPPLGRGPAESIAVSAFVLAEGRRVSALSEAYVVGLLADLAERLGLPPGRNASEHVEHIDRVSKRRGVVPAAAQLLSAARALSTDPKPRPRDAMQLATTAHALRERLLHDKIPVMRDRTTEES